MITSCIIHPYPPHRFAPITFACGGFRFYTLFGSLIRTCGIRRAAGQVRDVYSANIKPYLPEDSIRLRPGGNRLAKKSQNAKNRNQKAFITDRTNNMSHTAWKGRQARCNVQKATLYLTKS